MSDFTQDETQTDRPPRRWTGWTVLFALLGFFGVIFAVNGLMVYEALSTLSGVDTDSAYQAGLHVRAGRRHGQGAGRTALAGRCQADAVGGRRTA